MTCNVGDRVMLDIADIADHNDYGTVVAIEPGEIVVLWDDGSVQTYSSSAPYIAKIPSMEESPWYPDDSGEWVEVPSYLMEMPKALDANDKIKCLLNFERIKHKQDSATGLASAWAWHLAPAGGGRVVAYKVIQSVYQSGSKKEQPTTAQQFLQSAKDIIEERAKEYDSNEEGERSMNKTVLAFNTITGHTMSESDVKLLLQILNEVRSRSTNA